MKLIVFSKIKFRNDVVKNLFSGKNLDILEKNRIGVRRDGVLIALAEDDVVDIVPLVLYEAYKHGFLSFLENGYTAEDFRENEVYDVNDLRKPWGLGGLVTKPWDKDYVYYKQKEIILFTKFFKVLEEPHSKEKEKKMIEIGNEMKRLERYKFEKGV